MFNNLLLKNNSAKVCEITMQATSYNVGLGGSNFNTEIYMYKNDTMNCCSDELLLLFILI